MTRLFAALLFAAGFQVVAQSPQVPHKMEFAGITLMIRDDARREIQKDVDALTASPRYYKIKTDRAKMYFPIIEKIFREEGLPDDFKYLVLQESALIADAVSVSNAVGFWQFKDFTAMEMGLRIDRDIDERLNIASSSRAAARYIIKNNQHFDNWVYALQSYQMGAGGVMKSVKDTEPKAARMEITGKTYWYVKKFLAYKIAFEDGVKGSPSTQVVLFENRAPNSLASLAKETQVGEPALRELNKWAKSGTIPGDKTYLVLLPVPETQPTAVVALSEAVSDAGAAVRGEADVVRVNPELRARGKVNGIHTIRAARGDDASRLAERGAVDLDQFLKWNDLTLRDRIQEGQIYFLGRKRIRASEAFHKVARGETLWSISQEYGVQLRRLRRYNRMDASDQPAAGTMLYLASRRPKSDHVIADVQDPVEVNDNEAFSWAVQPATDSQEDVAASEDATTTVVEKAGTTVETEGEVVPLKDADSVKILQTNRTEVTLADTVRDIRVVARPQALEHTVKAGETLYGIAKMYQLSVMDIVTWNDLNLQQGIKPGQVLSLTSRNEAVAATTAVADGPVVQKQEVLHEVRTSDTLYSIARQYSVTIKEIMEWNQKKDFSLSIGEKLKIIPGH